MTKNKAPKIRPRPSRRSSAAEDEGAILHRDRWLISYADLVTLLFSLFVVLYAAADYDRARAVSEALAGQISGSQLPSAGSMPGGRGVLPGAESLVAARKAVSRAMAENEELRSRARVSNTERGLIISLAEAGFFAPGEATIRDDASDMLDELAETLRGTRTLVRVEGHTDSTPISTARYPSNWELSSARASAVLAQLVARGIESTRLSVAGYASERPVADNSTPEGRALNRRVDLVVLQVEK